MASMGKKAIQKQAVAYSMETGEEMARMDVSGFRLYVHYKYMDNGIDKHRLLLFLADVRLHPSPNGNDNGYIYIIYIYIYRERERERQRYQIV